MLGVISDSDLALHSKESMKKTTKQSTCSKTQVEVLKFVAFGNALVDISVKIDTPEILQRHNFGPNEQGECDTNKLNRVLRDLRNEYDNIDYHAGGSAINTCRILSELGQTDILFYGAVGQDTNGRLMQSMLASNNVNTCLQTIEGHATGSCVCIINEDNRCCFANIGASFQFSLDVLADCKHCSTMLNTSPLDAHELIFYIEGFFVTSRLPVCQYVFETFCRGQRRKRFAANLSAQYIINENPSEINYLADHADILFGNRDEFTTLTQINGYKTLDEQIERLMTRPECTHKIIVVTNGSKFVDVFVKEAASLGHAIQHERIDVVAVKKEDIVDTTGAGDSFVAGFFFALLQGDSVSECVRFGIETAAKKIRKIGAKL